MKVLSEFYVNFLGCVDGPTKTILIPYFKKQQDIPYNDIINHLSEAPSTVLMKDLLYSVLALEPDDFGKLSFNYWSLCELLHQVYNKPFEFWRT